MALIRKFALVGATAVAALMLMSTVALSIASAQPSLPYTVYGTGSTAASIEAFKGTVSVGKSAVVAGNWKIDIQPGGTANVTAGDKITLTIDGKAAVESVTWQSGKFSDAPGIKLTAATAAVVTPPAPAKTGNAGLFGTTGTSMALIVVLGVFAATMVAGARAATRGR